MTPMEEDALNKHLGERERRSSAANGSGLTDAEKIAKAIELLEWLHNNCLVPDLAHDAVNTCRLCRLLEQLKAPNDKR